MLKRTHNCGELTAELAGQQATVCGWVDNWRDHGGLFFIDLRDRYGRVQLVFSPENKAVYQIAKKTRLEFVIAVKGKVEKRPPEAVNPDLSTGEIEILAAEIEVLNPSETTPFEIKDYIDVSEDIRLKYRYLDLRRPKPQQALILRHQISQVTRQFFTQEGFIEVETPFLTKSTPEGARDFLVPARFQPGKFYALPQSPQTYKQILMISGFDKYFQIVRCFRDEALRKDRQLEFTQIDVEMSFVDEDDVMAVMERFMKSLFKEILDVDLETPFSRLSYHESMDRFGSDKPDTRFGLELNTITEVFRNSEFKVFRGVVEENGYIGALAVPEAAAFSRKQIDDLIKWSKSVGASGLAYLKYNSNAFDGGISKFLNETEKQALIETMELASDALILVIADKNKKHRSNPPGISEKQIGRRFGFN